MLRQWVVGRGWQLRQDSAGSVSGGGHARHRRAVRVVDRAYPILPGPGTYPPGPCVIDGSQDVRRSGAQRSNRPWRVDGKDIIMTIVNVITAVRIVPQTALEKIVTHLSLLCAPQCAAAVAVVILCLMGMRRVRQGGRLPAGLRRGRWYTTPHMIAVWVSLLSVVISMIVLAGWLLGLARPGGGYEAMSEAGLCERAAPILIGLGITCVSVLQYHVVEFVGAGRAVMTQASSRDQ